MERKVRAGELQVEEISDENFDMLAELSDEYQETVDKVRKVFQTIAYTE